MDWINLPFGTFLKIKVSDFLNNNANCTCGCFDNNRSSRELEISKFLRKNSIYFSKEWVVKHNNRSYRFDFALLDKKNKPILFIEEDGTYHELDQIQQDIDSLKDYMCEINKIKLIRIKHDENIEGILAKKLNIKKLETN